MNTFADDTRYNMQNLLGDRVYYSNPNGERHYLLFAIWNLRLRLANYSDVVHFNGLKMSYAA